MQKMPLERFNSRENLFLAIDVALERSRISGLGVPAGVLQLDEKEIINEINAI
jgi:hypothetical protein